MADSLLRRVRIKATTNTQIVKKRLRLAITTNYPNIFKRVRLSKNIFVDYTVRKRVRLVLNTSVTEYNNGETFPYINIINDSYVSGTIKNGIGSISVEDFELVSLDNSGITIKPGFFYYDYDEYFYYGDDYTIDIINSGEISKTYTKLNKPTRIPLTVTLDNVESPIVKTYNPSNKSNSLRKVVNLSGMVESIDGLSAYEFVFNSGDFYITESIDMFTIITHTDLLGHIKNIVSCNDNITYKLPDIIEYPDKIEGFLAITDEKKVVTSNGVFVFYPNIQYSETDTINITILVQTTNGEIADNYPLTINGITGYATNDNGVLELSLTNTPLLKIEDDIANLPDSYDSNKCTSFMKTIRFELITKV